MTSARSATLLAALCALVAAPVAAPGAAAQALPRLATQMPGAEMRVRPPVISYTGDGTGFVGGRTSRPPDHLDRGGINWRRWTQRDAFGRGWAWVNACRPSCAEGRFSKHRAKVRASRPRHGRFTRLVIVFRYGKRLIRDRRVLERAGGYWFWGV